MSLVSGLISTLYIDFELSLNYKLIILH